MKKKAEKAERKAKGRGNRGDREKKKSEEQKGKKGGRFSGFLPPYHRSEVLDGRETRARDEWESMLG